MPRPVFLLRKADLDAIERLRTARMWPFIVRSLAFGGAMGILIGALLAPLWWKWLIVSFCAGVATSAHLVLRRVDARRAALFQQIRERTSR